MWKLPRISWRGRGRRYLLYALPVAALLVVAALVLMTISVHLASQKAIWEIQTDWRPDLQSSFTWHGAGWSLQARHSSNLLQNSDFCGYTAKFSTPVLRTEGDWIWVSMRTDPNQQPYSQTLLGASLSRQSLHIVKEAVQEHKPHLIQFENDQLQVLNRSAERMVPEGEHIRAGAYRSTASGVQDSVFVGTHGGVYYDSQTGDPQAQPPWTQEDLVEVASCDSGYVVRSANGHLWGSADGQHWQAIPVPSAARVIGGQSVFWLLDREGRVLLLRPDWTSTLIREAPQGISAAAAVEGDSLWLPLRSGRCLRLDPDSQNSGDSEQEKKLNESGVDLGVQWVLGTQFGSQQYCVDREHHIWRNQAGQLVPLGLHTQNLPNEDPHQFFLFGEGRPALVFDSGLFVWNPDQEIWEELRTPQQEHMEAVLLFPNAILTAWTASGGMQSLSLQTRLRVDNTAWVQELRAGDRISLLKALAPAIPPVGWSVGEELRVLPWENPEEQDQPILAGEPEQALLLLPPQTGEGCLSQQLELRADQWPDRAFVTIQFRARPFEAADGRRDIGLFQQSGQPSEEGEQRSQSSTLTPHLRIHWTGPDGREQEWKVEQWENGDWTSKNLVFVANPWEEGAVRSKSEVGGRESGEEEASASSDTATPLKTQNLQNTHIGQLQLFVEGGPLLLSHIHLGVSRSQEGDTQLEDSVWERIQDSHPDVLRLASVHIGARGRGPFAWLRPDTEGSSLRSDQVLTSEGLSLQAALELARASGGDPWILLEPNTSFEEVLGLMEYLAGPTTSPFGAVRAKQGEVIPWSTQFQRIYFEFGGENPEASSDRERADGVDALLHVVQSSPYYQSMKNQLVFVDGIAYNRQEKLTRADEHASLIPVGFGEGLTAEQTYQALQSLFPRQNLHPEEGGAREVLLSVPLTHSNGTPYSLAHLIQFSLTGMGRLTHLILFDWEQGAQVVGMEQLQALQQILAPVPAGSHLLPFNRRLEPGQEEETAALAQIGSFASLSPEGKPHLVFTNTNAETMQIRFTSENRSVTVEQTRYDSSGHILDQAQRSGTSFLIEIPAGGVVEWQGEVLED